MWPEASLLPSLSQTSSLEIYDLRAASPEVLLSVSTLVGLINRGPARVYCLENSDDEFWLKELDPSLACISSSVAGDKVLEHLLVSQRELVVGLVIYDPRLLDTRNVATTLAALRGGIVATPELASRLQQAPYHLTVLEDLRVYNWKSRAQAYFWAYKHLLPECSPDLLAGMAPTLCGGLRSYLVTQRVFTSWLDARKIIPEFGAGGYCERGLLKRLFASFHPGALHLGWFVSEPFGIRLASRAALLTLASDHCTNLAVWSSMPGQHEQTPSLLEQITTPSTMGQAPEQTPAPSSSTMEQAPEQTPAPTPSTMGQAPEQTSAPNSSAMEQVPEQTPASFPSTSDGAIGQANEPSDADVTYLSFTISDGDNLQYCQHRLLRLWSDPARGKLPLGWTIAPALWQTMPRLAAFYRRTASEQDSLIAGPSGVAYILPSYWPREHRVAFLQLTATALHALGPALLQVLDSGTWFSMRFLSADLQELFVSQLAAHGLRGILSGAGSGVPSWQRRSGLLVYQNLGLALNPQHTLNLIQKAHARGMRFINVYILAWDITPSDLLRIVQQLEGKVHAVTPARLLELIEAAAK